MLTKQKNIILSYIQWIVHRIILAIIIQKDATEYSLFKSVNYSTCFGWYFTHHQELIKLYLQYLALRPVLLPAVKMAIQLIH